MGPKPARLVDSIFGPRAQPGDFAYSIAVPDDANPENLPINDPRLDGVATRYGILLACPNCGRVSGLALDVPDHAKKQGPKWTWDGNVQQPTCTPSIRVIRRGDRPQCGFHGYITAGTWTFCDDTVCDPPGPDDF